MRFKKLFFSTALIFISIAMAYSIYGYHKTKQATVQMPKTTDYTKNWKTVEAFEKKGLSKSALEIVMQIYKKAKAENNAAQLVKAIIHRMKFEQLLEEDADVKAIAELKEELKTAQYPLKPILQSMLAETYWSYYQTHRWKFQNRTTTTTPDPKDISTWDLKTIFSKTIENYNASLQEKEKLKQTAVNIYDEVLTVQKDTRKYRPTLFDFLAHRAVDFYKNEEAGLLKPAYKFELNDATYFSPAIDFAKQSITTKDSLSSNYYALKLMQELITFHLNQSNQKAELPILVDLDLERLKFVREKSVVETKDSLYLLALQQLEKQVHNDPASGEVNYEIARVYADKGAGYNALKPDGNKWMKKQALELCETVIKQFPESLGANNCKALKQEIEAHQLEFKTDKIISPDKPALGLLSYSNLKKVYLRVVQLDATKNEANETGLYGEELLKQYLKYPALKEWTLDLPDDGDHQLHATEIRIPELAVGRYVLLIGSAAGFSYKNNGVVYTEVLVSGISYITREMTNGSVDCYVKNRETGAPLKGAEVQLFGEEYDYNTSKRKYKPSEKYITDENGYFNIAPAKAYRNARMDFTYNSSTSLKNTKDFLRVDNAFYQYEKDIVEKKKTPRTFFFLDRGIYRPGQTIYFKGILINSDEESNEILPKTKTRVALMDVNGNEVTALDLITNDYGTFNGSFTAPLGVLNGDMSIINESGAAYFSVEEYKRPKFEVIFKPSTGNYRLNDLVQVGGNVKAFSGANLSGAEVKYRVVRNVIERPYPYYSRKYTPGRSREQMEIISGTTTTSDSGSFSINFKAIPDAKLPKEDDPVFSYTVYADVTDINGETHSAEKRVKVGYEVLNLEINLPESVDKTVEADFPVRITNMNDIPVPTAFKVEIFRLKQPDRVYRQRNWTQPDQHILSKGEFEKEFPTDPYANEDDNATWERQEKVLDKTVDEKTQALKIPDFKNWQSGVYVVEAYCKDIFGGDVKTIQYLTVYSPVEKQVPVNQVNWFAAPAKKSYEPGEKAMCLIGSKENNVSVTYEIERRGVILKKESFVLNQQQKLIEIPIEEAYRGGVAIHYVFIKNNRAYTTSSIIIVPYTNKELDIQFETFRNKLLPGEQEEWKLKIKDKKGDKAIAEMVATLYDASLDQFRENNWFFEIYRNQFNNLRWESQNAFNGVGSELFAIDWNGEMTLFSQINFRTYDQLNWFGLQMESIGRYNNYSYNASPYSRMESKMMANDKSASKEAPPQKSVGGSHSESETNKKEEKSNEMKTIATRKNFSETAFFYPQLETDKEGSLIIKFTIPEATTRWKMMGFAHTKDLKSGMISKELVTQKQLMVVPNAPRFFRENDKLELTSKITNMSDTDMSGDAQLFLYDAKTMTEIATMFADDKPQKSFILSKGQNTVVGWTISIPENVDAITYKVVAKAGNFTDGEEMTLPVLTNRMLITESLPLYVNENQTKTFRFEKLGNQNNGSTTLRNRNLTLEFTSNPAWYAVQALPYLMEYPYDCSEQIFFRFYANSMASHIANSSPKIKAVFDAWKNAGGEKSALLSNLEKNQELKSVLLEETPWVMEAKGETERKKRVGLLFDLNKMSNEFKRANEELKKRQLENGSWPWFAGMPEDRYITQYIVTGIGHLDHLQVKSARGYDGGDMLEKAIGYLDAKIADDYNWLLKHNKSHMEENQLGALQIQYLYARSYFKDIPVIDKSRTAVAYYLKQAEKYWLYNSRYLQGMIALTLNRNDKKQAALGIMKSLKENSITSEEMGMYWKERYDNYYWHQSPIEAQALLIEAFDEVANDTKSVDALKIWLLRSKQTQNWKTTKATAEAVYALLLKGSDWLSTENAVEIKVGSTIITADKDKAETKPEAGTGYFKTSWSGSDIQTSMADVTITKKDAGISWGSMYWQYFEQLDKITPSKTPLQLKKNLFLQKNTDAGFVLEPIIENTKLKVGDKIIVRIELRSDRDMEYVHMKDMRASGLEPINVLSTYKYQDGLGYYESTRDASTNFFFGSLSKGSYVFEYPLMITHEGDFSNGVTTIQCMYAPEFTSNSEGVRVHIGE